MNRMKPDSAADRTGKSEKSEETGKKRKDRDGRGGVKPGGELSHSVDRMPGFKGFPVLFLLFFSTGTCKKRKPDFVSGPFPPLPLHGMNPYRLFFGEEPGGLFVAGAFSG